MISLSIKPLIYELKKSSLAGKSVMNRLFIITHAQFGYHTDQYYYCKYLKDFYNISYICFDNNQKKINLDGLHIIYVKQSANSLVRQIRYFSTVINYLNKGYDIAFITYFKFCSVLRLFLQTKKTILNIRTSIIHGGYLRRSFYNYLIRFESHFYKNITVISEGLIDFLKLSKEKCFVLPVGAIKQDLQSKNFKKLNLLYVGTFFKRNIHFTVEAFARLVKELGDEIEMSYDIIGFGPEEEVNKIKNSISNNNLDKYVTYFGNIRYPELTHYLQKNNIGVSFIPITDFYNHQPATKTFEYLLSGMAVIATATDENKKVINNHNGILIQDNAESFYEGLNELINHLDLYHSTEIQTSAEKYTWENIVLNILYNYLRTLIRESN